MVSFARTVFSDGQPMTLDEINLDQVIMSPEMLRSLEDENKDTIIHTIMWSHIKY